MVDARVSVDAFERALGAGDVAAAVAVLAEHAQLFSPGSPRPVRGRDAVAAVLSAVVAGTTEFRYVGRLAGELTGSPDATPVHGLIFRARVDGLELHGVDLLECGEDGLVHTVTVLARPINAATALVEAVRSAVAGSATG